MIEFNVLINSWPIIASFVGLIVWFIRLEGKTQTNKDAIKSNSIAIRDIQIKHDLLYADTITILNDIRERLARIEGQLSNGSHN